MSVKHVETLLMQLQLDALITIVAGAAGPTAELFVRSREEQKHRLGTAGIRRLRHLAWSFCSYLLALFEDNYKACPDVRRIELSDEAREAMTALKAAIDEDTAEVKREAEARRAREESDWFDDALESHWEAMRAWHDGDTPA
jgi:hypothetical protein